MTVIYLYDIDGWALHAIGIWLAQALTGPEMDFRLMQYDAWRANPVPCDVLYLSYSGLVEPGIDYRKHAGRVVTTIHDPCELSFFEQRDDWAQLPMGRLPVAQVDRFSAISSEIRDVLRRRYDLDAIFTPTWSPRCESLRSARRQPGDGTGSIQVMSSTNVSVRRPVRDILRRIRHPAPFFRDEHGRLSLRQLSALPVRRRRKRVEWLTQIARAAGERSGIHCEFAVGGSARRSEQEYETALHRCDVYVCTSTMEGGPLPVLEAVMAGAAVLSTRVGQVPTWIEDGGSGYFCSSVAEFSHRLNRYADDRGLLLRHQARAREIADALVPDLTGWRALLAVA